MIAVPFVEIGDCCFGLPDVRPVGGQPGRQEIPRAAPGCGASTLSELGCDMSAKGIAKLCENFDPRYAPKTADEMLRGACVEFTRAHGRPPKIEQRFDREHMAFYVNLR